MEVTAVNPRDIDSGGSHTWELLLLCGHCCKQVSFWDPPSSLLAPRPGSAQQPIEASAGTLQTKQLGGDIAPAISRQAA